MSAQEAVWKRLVFLGAPGSGKGTMAELLSAKAGLVHISTGDMLRENVKEGTELGLKAKGYMDAGELVPDEVMVAMVADRLSRDDVRGSGFILDGFPRTMVQGESLDRTLDEAGMALDRVLLFDAPDETILERLTGRRVCRKCGRVYHIRFIPPKKEGVCDVCGGELYQRPDDREETIRNRLEVYRRQTADLIGYYEKKGLLTKLDASLPRDEAFAKLWEVVRRG